MEIVSIKFRHKTLVVFLNGKKGKINTTRYFVWFLPRKFVVSDFANLVNNDRRGVGIGAKDAPSNFE